MRVKKTRIIHLIADSGLTGAPIQLFNLLQNIDRKKYELLVVCPQGQLQQKLDTINVEYKTFEFNRSLFASRKLHKIIKPYIADQTIIHCQGVKAGYFGRGINKRLKLPLIYTEHNWTKDYTLPQNWRRIYQLKKLAHLDKYTTHTVAVSEAVRDFLVSQKITPRDKVSVIYNGVDFKKITKREDEDTIVIGTIGSFHKRKGFVYLLEAFAELKKHEKKKLLLKIIGKGPLSNFLKQHSVDLGINFDISWQEDVEDLTDFWEGINLYVQPSLDESFGMAVAEAMGYKIPVVATTAGALSEVVEDGGLLVEPANYSELADAIHNVIHNKLIREENVELAYKRVRENYTIKRMVENYETLYSKIISTD